MNKSISSPASKSIFHKPKNLISYLMLMPYGVVFIVFVFVPAIISVFLSFTSFNMLQTPNFVGLSNFIRLFLDDDVFLIAIRNTMILAVITGPIGYIMSFILAWLINELGSKIRGIPTIVFYMPSLAGNIFFIWKFIFDNDSYGLLNGWMIRLGIINEPLRWLTDPKYGLFIVSVVVLWMSAGAGFLTFIAGLQSMNHELFEAAAIDGVRNRWQELWFVTLPQMKPQLLLGAIFTISGSFAIGYQCQALTGFPSTDYSTHTILLHIIDYGFVRYEMGYACAIQLVLFGVMLLSWYGINKFLSKWDS
ncbi:MAG: carbohydrate ABC transporter permease [Saccharofermentanales bacterium]